MTKKRFTIAYNERIEMMQYIDNEKEEPNRWAIWNATETAQKLNALHEENKQLKSELQRIYDIATVNKVKNIVEEIYDDLLYETSEKSDYAREMLLKCLKRIEWFGDDLE